MRIITEVGVDRKAGLIKYRMYVNAEKVFFFEMPRSVQGAESIKGMVATLREMADKIEGEL